jgi:uncharacterized membrane protein YphA (DoxX/SURF4 family)
MMADGRIMNMISIGARMILGALFIYASWHKIAYPGEFANVINNYQILPAELVNPAAVLLPWLEMVCGLCMISGLLVRGSAFILSLLLLVFIAALIYSLLRGLDISCGCFGLQTEGAAREGLAIARDLVLIGMALWVLWRPGKIRGSMAITPARGLKSP